MLEKLTKLVSKFPKTVIAVTIMLTVFFSFGLLKLDIISDLEEMIPENDPVRMAYDEVDERSCTCRVRWTPVFCIGFENE